MKIRIKLMILLSLASLVTSLCVVFVYTTLISEQIQNNILNNLDTIAENEKRRIASSIDHSYQFLATNTARPNMILRLDNYNKLHDPADQENMHAVLDSIKKSSSTVRRASLINPDGIIVASSDRSYIGTDLSKSDFITISKNGSSYYDMSKFEDGTLGIRLAGPLYLNDTFVGIIALVLEPDEIINFNYAGVGKSGDIYLVKKESDQTITFLTPSRFDDTAAFNKKISIGKNPASRAVSGIEGTFLDLPDYRGVEVFSATKYIEGVNWGLVVKTDVSEAMIPVNQIRNFTLSVGVVLTATLLLVAYYFSKIISNPIRSLQRSAQQISLGLDAKIDIKSNDEIGQLARSIDHMLLELKRAADLQIETEKLRQIDKEKEEFSAMVTHELKTPLIPISGYSELFLDGSLGNLTDGQKEKMRIIYENAIRLMSLIQDILDARKIELGRLNLSIHTEQLREIVKRSIDIFKPISEQKRIQITNNIQDVLVRCDSDRILQVLNNVIYNSLKFTPPHRGIISISSRTEDGVVIVSIRDNGVGIPKEKQERLFKKFYQVDKTLTRRSGGTGLGLAISRGIIESHGGKIWVESEENDGTTIHFTIPAGNGK